MYRSFLRTQATMLLAAAVLTAPALAVPFDVTNPGDAITPSSGNHPGGEAAPNAIDNRYNTKYLNFDELNTGYTVTPAVGTTVIRAMTITSANDASERDPASYQVLGSNDGVNFDLISSGAVPAFAGRFQQQDITFDNATAYSSYHVLFPTVANAGAANSMQVGEVQLLTHGDVTGAADFIKGSSTNTPGGERVRNVIDNNYNNKYLNFDKLNTGFTVTPIKGLSVVSGISITSGNDSPDRDPASYEVYGSNDGINFTLLGSGAVPAFANRFEQKEFEFANAQEFKSYRVVFPTVANAAGANSMQVTEVQLLGDVTTAYRQTNLNLSAAFNADVVLNNGTGSLDASQNGIDGGGRNYMTQAVADAIGGGLGNGLPNDGVVNTPFGAIQLGFNNNDDGNNAIRLTNGQSAQIDLGKAATQFAGIYLFATSGDGDSTVEVTYNYLDGTTGTETIIIDDWFQDDGELGNGVFALINGLDRTNGPGNGFENNSDPAIFAIGLAPDFSRVLTGLEFNQLSGGVTSIFGAAGVGLPPIPEPTTATLGLLAMGCLIGRRRRTA